MNNVRWYFKYHNNYDSHDLDDFFFYSNAILILSLYFAVVPSLIS